MQLHRPHILLLQLRAVPEFSLDDLLAGGAGVLSPNRWVALAPHLDEEVLLELEDLAILEALADDAAVSRDVLAGRFGEARVDALVAAGLLLSDQPEHERWRARDRALRETAWWAPAAVAQAFGRWQDVDVSADEQRGRTLAGMVEKNGLPPPATLEVRPREHWQPMPQPARTPLDTLLSARSTCRNFDAAQSIPLADLATTLHRVFAAQATQELGPGTIMLKKNSPSGGGLHPVEAFVLVQAVDGLAPGLYHYVSTAHSHEPMQLLPPTQLRSLAHELVAGQSWFANAPVLVLMAARFQRNFWKYRNHAKSWKVIQLDAGHLSQNLYLSATELGYGAFVTAAINDRCAERVFELDGLSTGAVAVCGFGRRAPTATHVEFDPLGKAVR
ncbi:MAG: putative peptide maturation dehydrogenase [Arenimonas sp.]